MSRKHLKIPSIIGLIILAFNSYIFCQQAIIFNNSSHLLPSESNSRLALAFADVNGDFRDDLIHTDIFENIVLDLQLNNGQLLRREVVEAFGREIYTINVGDLNNDGISEIYCAGRYLGFMQFSYENNAIDSHKEIVDDRTFFAQGSSISDIDNDGLLDILYTHDDGENVILINQNDTLIQEPLIDFNTIPPSDNSGNYSSVWFDADADNDLDLYLAKCRVNAFDPTDPRRKNVLYLNEGGIFTESSAKKNLDIGAQSWAVDAGDLDNDGDEDLFLINHDAPHMLLRNDGNAYTIIDSFCRLGPIETPDLQVHLADFNNDMRLDILIAGQRDYLLTNQGGLYFDVNENPFGGAQAGSFVCGDINNDGYLDSYVSYAGAKPDELHTNFGGENNFVKFTLVGNTSNRNGIGSKIELYTNRNKLVRWLKSGSSYGITNSLNVHFGLAENEVIDSIICYWPSGIEDRHYDLTVDQHFVMEEGRCISEIFEFSTQNYVLDCNITELNLALISNDEFVVYDSLLSDNITISEPHFLRGVNPSEECANSSPWIWIDTLKALPQPKLNVDSEEKIYLCDGSEFPLSTNIPESYEWSSGEEAEIIEITESGTYFISLENACERYNSDSLEIEFFSYEYHKDTLSFFEPKDEVIIELDAQLDTRWYYDELLNDELSDDPILVIEDIERDTIFYYTQSLDPLELDFQSVLDESYFDKDFDNNNNRKQFFQVKQKLLLNSVSLTARIEGTRLIQLYNRQNELIKEWSVNLGVGKNSIDLNIQLDKEIYYLTTDETTNKDNLGTKSPQLNVTEKQLELPLEQYGYMTLFDDENQLFYFYDWNISSQFPSCSVREGYYYIDIKSNASSDISIANFKCYPNPFNELLEMESSNRGRVTITDCNGKMLYSQELKTGTNTLRLEAIPSGLYLLNFISDLGVSTQKLVKY